MQWTTETVLHLPQQGCYVARSATYLHYINEYLPFTSSIHKVNLIHSKKQDRLVKTTGGLGH